MTTTDELIRDIIASLPGDLEAPLVARWLNNRYQELTSRVRFRHLRKIGEVILPPVVNNGTVSVTRGSTSVAGVGTTFVTSIGSGNQEFYYFKTRSAWYKVASIGGEGTLTLASAFAEDDVSAGSYAIVKKHIGLASDARWLGEMMIARLRMRLSLISLTELNITAPGRELTQIYPSYAAQVGTTSTNELMFEFYPYCKVSEIIQYVYWSLPAALTFATTIPPVIDPYTLKEGALIDAYRWVKINSINKGNVEAAAVYANEEAKQRTIWEHAIRDAIKAQRGVDDVTLLIESFGGRKVFNGITNAYQQVLSNWNWGS